MFGLNRTATSTCSKLSTFTTLFTKRLQGSVPLGAWSKSEDLNKQPTRSPLKSLTLNNQPTRSNHPAPPPSLTQLTQSNPLNTNICHSSKQQPSLLKHQSNTLQNKENMARVCPECGKQYAHQSGLSKHTRKVHGTSASSGKIICSECERR